MADKPKAKKKRTPKTEAAKKKIAAAQKKRWKKVREQKAQDAMNAPITPEDVIAEIRRETGDRRPVKRPKPPKH